MVLISVSAAFLINYNTSKYGAGLTPDSLAYIATSEKILDDPLVFFSDYQPLAIWPPLYPLLLSIFSFISSIEPLNVAHLLNSVLIFFFFITSAIILNKLLNLKTVSIVLLIYMIVLNKIPIVFIQAWSEPPFLLLINIYILVFLKYNQESNNKCFILLSMITFLLSMTRYIGIAFIIPTFYSFLKSNIKIKSIFLGFCILILPFGLYLLRNYYFTKTLMGLREPSKLSIFDSFRLLFNEMYSWIVSFKLNLSLGINEKSFILLFLLLYVFSFTFLFQNKHDNFRQTYKLLLLMFFSYILFILYTSSTVQFDNINYRLMIPVFPIIIYIFAIFINSKYNYLLVTNDKLKGNMFLFCIFFIVSFNLFFNAKELYNGSKSRHLNGAGGANSIEFRGSKLNDFLIENDFIYPNIYSNYSYAVVVICKKETIQMPKSIKTIIKSKDKYDSSYFAYYAIRKSKYDYTMNDLDKLYYVDTIFRYKNDVIIYTNGIRNGNLILNDSIK